MWAGGWRWIQADNKTKRFTWIHDRNAELQRRLVGKSGPEKSQGEACTLSRVSGLQCEPELLTGCRLCSRKPSWDWSQDQSSSLDLTSTWLCHLGRVAHCLWASLWGLLACKMWVSDSIHQSEPWAQPPRAWGPSSPLWYPHKQNPGPWGGPNQPLPS